MAKCDYIKGPRDIVDIGDMPTVSGIPIDTASTKPVIRSVELSGYALVADDWVASLLATLEKERAHSDRLAVALASAQRHASDAFFAADDILVEHRARRGTQ